MRAEAEEMRGVSSPVIERLEKEGGVQFESRSKRDIAIPLSSCHGSHKVSESEILLPTRFNHSGMIRTCASVPTYGVVKSTRSLCSGAQLSIS